MAQSLFELSNATFGDTKHTYVKASLNGATRTREVTVFAAGIASFDADSEFCFNDA